MRKNIIIKLTMIFTLISSLILAPEISAKTEAYGAFNVIPQLPENQQTENVGYFDLRMEVDAEQKISFDINNSGDDIMTANISLYNGYTDINAQKSYDKETEVDESMVMPMTEMATLEKTEVIVKPNTTERVFITLKAPSEPFDGVSLGGITVTADYDNKTPDKEEGVTVDSRLAYMTALQISMTDTEISKNLNYVKSSAEFVLQKPQFVSYIQNDKPIVMNDVVLEGEVKNQDGKTVANIKKENGGILPNTTFKVAYELVDQEEIEKGKYSLELKISSEEDVWEWKESVQLGQEDLDNLVEEEEPVEKDNTIIYLIGILITLSIALIVIILVKRKKDN